MLGTINLVDIDAAQYDHEATILSDKPINCVIFVVWLDVPFKLVVDSNGTKVIFKSAFGQTNVFSVVHAS